jgi:formylglycine-generating enzyme required for sulfatase activity
MPATLEPIGFWSYTSSDDTASGGDLSHLRRVLRNDLQRLIGREPEVRIFQDANAIPKGADWEDRINEALDTASFIIPILTPAFLQSEWCCKEVLRFREREKALGRNNLIFPFHLTNTDHLDDGDPREVRDKTVHALLRSRQMLDFRPLELEDPNNRLVLRKLRELSESIYHALRDGRRPGAVPGAAIGTPVSSILAGDGDAAGSGLPAHPVPGPVQTLAESVAPGAIKPAAPEVSTPKPAWAAATGTDSFGIWADIAVPARSGAAVTQRLRRIPTGRFQMGSPDNEPGRYDDEGPRHAVAIAEHFWMFDTPCTQALWQAVMGDNPSRFKSPTRPVEMVSFEDVQRFLTEINNRVPGLVLTLPSEARWEYACRAGTDTATYAGPIEILGANNAPVSDKIAWYAGNSGLGFELDNGYDSSAWPEKQYEHRKAGTHPVKGKAPNAWGLYDMLGNVWEWCEDRWHDSYKNAPTDESAWLSDSAAKRVLRGGSWGGESRLVRAACRFRNEPDDRSGSIGFRCVRGHLG